MTFRIMPTGFSTYQHFGLRTAIASTVLRKSLIPISASAVLGIYILFPPPQCVPIEATENVVHGGDAQRISGSAGKRLKSMSRMFAVNLVKNIGFESVVKGFAPYNLANRANELVRAKNSA